MNVVEEGWRADGWYQIDGADALKAGDDTDWYYFKDGKAKKADDGEKNNTDLTDDVLKYIPRRSRSMARTSASMKLVRCRLVYR